MSGKAQESERSFWQVVGASVRGASHVRRSLPNEDAWGMWQSPGGGDVVLGAVADGHGSARCVRSHIGARLAIEAVRCAVSRQADDLASDDDAALRRAAQRLPQEIVDAWRALVADDLLRQPLCLHEFDGLAEHEREATRRVVVLDPVQAYGSTLLATVVTPRHVIYANLGDGDILSVESTGTCRHATTADERLIANDTTSLCSRGAVADFQVRCEPRDASSPGLIVLCTDGVTNAFRTGEGFLSLGTDLLDDLRARPAEEVARELPDWLEDFSTHGSGDDATMCLLVAPSITRGVSAMATIPCRPPVAVQPSLPTTKGRPSSTLPGIDEPERSFLMSTLLDFIPRPFRRKTNDSERGSS